VGPTGPPGPAVWSPCRVASSAMPATRCALFGSGRCNGDSEDAWVLRRRPRRRIGTPWRTCPLFAVRMVGETAFTPPPHEMPAYFHASAGGYSYCARHRTTVCSPVKQFVERMDSALRLPRPPRRTPNPVPMNGHPTGTDARPVPVQPGDALHRVESRRYSAVVSR